MSDNFNNDADSLYYLKAKRPRLVQKNGELNINTFNIPKHRRRLLSDFFNTILDVKWRWHVIIFILSFILSWFFFAAIWYAIAYLHDDIGENDVQDFSTNGTSSTQYTHLPCVSGVHDFTSALLYSIETQHTIGYGHRHITEQCPYAIVFLMIQSCIGLFIQGLVAGIVFAKLSRPNKRKRTIIFSNNAVVTERDGNLCFLIKIGNIRSSQLSDARIRLIMIKSRLTKEGEFIPLQCYEMKVGQEWSGRDSIFFPWPKIVEHIIDKNSPLYDIIQSNNRVNNEYDYEIVVILEGNIETTGASCHIRTSYVPEEILFGYRFIIQYPTVTNCGYSFDFSKFNQIEPVNTNLYHLNRNQNFMKLMNQLNKANGGRNYTKSLPTKSFYITESSEEKKLKKTKGSHRKAHKLSVQQQQQQQQQPSSSSSLGSSRISLESIFRNDVFKSKGLSPKQHDSINIKQRKSSLTKISPIKNGRFTIVPVSDDDDDDDDVTKSDKRYKSNRVHRSLISNNNSETNEVTITSSIHFDEGYLTCKPPESKKPHSNDDVDSLFK